MYPIDFMTCTAAELIERSLVCHPSLFIDALSVAEREHLLYASAHEGPGKAGAMIAGQHCAFALSSARDMNAKDAAADIASRIGPRVQSVTIAARLQCVPRSLWGEIAERA